MAKPPKPKAQPVSPLSDKEVQHLIQWIDANTVHFSFKGINSNASPGGIRVGKEQALPDLPYISLRTLMGDGLHFDVDYVCAAREGGPKLKQAADILGHLPASDGHNQATHGELFYPHYVRAQTTPLEIGTNSFVSPRLRQILLPREDGYLSVSPLGAAGLNKEIFSVARQFNKQVWEASHPSANSPPVPEKFKGLFSTPFVGAFSIGGANPQNIGRLIRDGFTSPLFFDNIPNTEDGIRLAFKVHHNGFRPSLKPYQIRAYADVHRKLLALPESSWKYGALAEEAAVLKSLALTIEQQAIKIGALLDMHSHILPNNTAFSSPEHKEHFDIWRHKHLRDETWEKRQIEWVISRLNGFELKVGEDGYAEKLLLSAADKERITKSLQGVLV